MDVVTTAFAEILRSVYGTELCVHVWKADGAKSI